MSGNSSNIMPTTGSSDDNHCNSIPALEISLLEISLSRDGSEVEVDGFHSFMCDSANDSTKYSRPSVSQLSGNPGNITPTTVPMAAEILEVVQDTPKEEVSPLPELEPELVIAKQLVHNTEAAGAALGEHPTLGIKTAEQNFLDAEFVLHSMRVDLRQMQAKYINLQQQMHNPQELSKEEKKRLTKQIKELKAGIADMKITCATCEEAVHEARIAYQREILRTRNA